MGESHYGLDHYCLDLEETQIKSWLPNQIIKHKSLSPWQSATNPSTLLSYRNPLLSVFSSTEILSLDMTSKDPYRSRADDPTTSTLPGTLSISRDFGRTGNSSPRVFSTTVSFLKAKWKGSECLMHHIRIRKVAWNSALVGLNFSPRQERRQQVLVKMENENDLAGGNGLSKAQEARNSCSFGEGKLGLGQILLEPRWDQST